MSKRYNFIWFCVFTLLSFITVVIIDFNANATYDSGDGLQHYLICKYSWQHPELFLDMWGKPFFTLISSPFAQFGIFGMYFFQALCAAFTCFFLYKIAFKLELAFSFLIPILVFFAPIYFAVINTGLTEICFGCFFMLSVWLIFEKQYAWAAIVASVIPFIRQEAFVILPLILIVLIARKQYKSIPLLFTAFVAYTCIGFFYLNDVWWIITKSKQLMQENYVGMKGSIFYYLIHFREVLSTTAIILLVVGIGIFAALIRRIYKTKIVPSFFLEELVLIYGCFFGCFVLHSLLYAMPGLMTNLGLPRYLTTIVPCSILITLRGFNYMKDNWKFNNTLVNYGIVIVMLFSIIVSPFKHLYFPFYLSAEQRVIHEVGIYMNPILNTNMVCYLHPYLPMVSKIDPFDKEKTKLIWSVEQNRFQNLPDSTILVWDSHFAPQEGKLALQTLLASPYFKPLMRFKYFNSAKPFDAWVFLKQDSTITSKKDKPNFRIVF